MQSYKTFLLFLGFMLSGCASLIEPTTVRDSRCYQSPHLKVFQVLDDGALAHICPAVSPYYTLSVFEACFSGDLVFLKNSTRLRSVAGSLVDDQKITLDETKCFVPSGTYTYFTTKDLKKTVREVELQEALIPNPRLPQNQKLTSGESTPAKN